MRGVVTGAMLALALCGPLGAPARAQEGTLADIRQELSVLYVEIQRLKRELSTTGNPSIALGGASAVERLDRIEAELQRITSQAEQMEMRLNRVVSEGTNKIGDLEFRLCELEPDCDISKLGDTPTLGGDVPAPVTPVTPTAPVNDGGGGGGELAMGEQADFDTARAAFDGGEFERAASLFQAFTDTYTGGPLNAQAHYLRGEALAASGQTAAAARAYLDSFRGAPNGPSAADALLKLGISLAELGQRDEACVMLAQVSARFAGTDQAASAQGQAQAMTCP